MVRSTSLLALLIILALTAPSTAIEQPVDQPALQDPEIQDEGYEGGTGHSGMENPGDDIATKMPIGPSDEDIEKEEAKRNWLPEEQTGLGMPQSAVGGGFPDPSLRTGTFGMETSIPGAGGTRAGR